MKKIDYTTYGTRELIERINELEQIISAQQTKVPTQKEFVCIRTLLGFADDHCADVFESDEGEWDEWEKQTKNAVVKVKEYLKNNHK